MQNQFIDPLSQHTSSVRGKSTTTRCDETQDHKCSLKTETISTKHTHTHK